MRVKIFVVIGISAAIFMTAAASIAPPLACAHAPIFKSTAIDTPETAYDVGDASEPKVFYGKLEPIDDVSSLFDQPAHSVDALLTVTPYDAYLRPVSDLDVYAVHVKDDAELRIRLMVPRKSGCESFKPHVLLVGPGLDKAPRPLPKALRGMPNELLTGGAQMNHEASVGERRSFFDPFTMMSFYDGPQISQRVAGGTYYAIVFDPEGGRALQGARGEYALEIGEGEGSELPPMTLIARPVDVLRIKLGAYD